LFEGGRLLPFVKYLLSLLVSQHHAAEPESIAIVPTPPPANNASASLEPDNGFER
jgi:hypothetical protein